MFNILQCKVLLNNICNQTLYFVDICVFVIEVVFPEKFQWRNEEN